MDVPHDLKEDMQHNILSRLKKIEGQIRGLQGMVDAGKECMQILTQLRAAQAALKSVGNLVLRSYLMKCYVDLGSEPSAEEVFRRLEKTVDVLAKFIGG
jgi:CsoR family transcriptional regulator, copper-sensing transcriptional repressor